MKSTLIVLLVILVVVGGIWYLRGDEAEEPETNGTSQQQNDTNTPANSNSNNLPSTHELLDDDDAETVVEEIPNGLQGELQSSNDANRGNLMLLLSDSDRIIYLNTSRDYSGLIGKDVLVKIDGSLDDFRLVDIVEQGN